MLRGVRWPRRAGEQHQQSSGAPAYTGVVDPGTSSLRFLVAELTGSSGGAASALSRLRDTAGIDVLRFGSTETDEGEQATTLEAGKYVAEGLYVGVETSTAEESGAVSVEFDITRRLRLKTDLEQAGGQNIGIEYKRDY